MIRWAVQTNLGKQYSEDLKTACKSLGHEFKPFMVIPFCDAAPNLGCDKPTVFYGATRWIDNIYRNNKWNPGVFFNPESVYTYWAAKYKGFTLNSDARHTTLNELGAEDHPKDELMFIRPESDQKEFAGDVMKFGDIKQWSRHINCDDIDLGSVPIIVAPPVGIAHEWRMFMVDGEPIAGSHYRSYHKLKVSPDVPSEVMEFTRARAKEYSPSPVFIMDIGESGGDLYVVEIGCFNSAGFYDADVEKIVDSVSQYIMKDSKCF